VPKSIGQTVRESFDMVRAIVEDPACYHRFEPSVQRSGIAYNRKLSNGLSSRSIEDADSPIDVAKQMEDKRALRSKSIRLRRRATGARVAVLGRIRLSRDSKASRHSLVF